jgi:hypothetical protein
VSRLLILALSLAVVGCLPIETVAQKESTPLVPANPLDAPPPVPQTAKANYPRGKNEELALRVDYVGRKLVAANKDMGLRPLFATIGSPNPEIFHQGTHMVHITEGMVKQCKNEAELAAVLAHELGRMVADREAFASPQVRSPDKLPPIDVPIGNGTHFSGPDQTNLFELAKHEKENPRTPRRLPRPNPRALAQIYLQKAGYRETDLLAVDPLLQAAERNYSVEKQFKMRNPPSPPPANLTPKWMP